MNKILITKGIILALLTSSSIALADDDITLSDLRSGKIRQTQAKRSFTMADSMREEALRDIALSIGASAGLAHQFKKEYADILEKRGADLDKAFDFKSVRLSNGVLPPVISQSFSVYEAQSNDVVMIGEKNFKIEKPARIVSAYPTWRDYLQIKFEAPEIPQSNYMPRTKKERKIWDEAVEEGWELGKKQATEAWTTAFAELRRDYEGMLLYRTLLMQGKITPTLLSSTHLGTLVNEDGTVMSQGVQQIGIVQHSTFDRNQAVHNGASNPSTFKSKTGKRF